MNSSTNQTWLYDPSKYIFYPSNDSSLCIDLFESNTTNGSYVQYYECTGNNNQQWYLSSNTPINCNTNGNQWLYECNYPNSNNSYTKNNCNSGSNCEQNKIAQCNTTSIDLSNPTNQNCLFFCQNNPSLCPVSLNTYCNNVNYVNTTTCQNWCKSNNCDTGMNAYCSANPNDNYLCSCFDTNAINNVQNNVNTTVASTLANQDVPAICWNANCSNFGYFTSEMKNLVSSCPACIQVANFDNITAGSATFKNINQNCNR